MGRLRLWAGRSSLSVRRFTLGCQQCARQAYQGADLAYVLCYKEAAIPVKSFSPDLIVIPLLPLSDYESKQRFQQFVKIANSVVVGPGLGRDVAMLKEFGFLLDCLANKTVICDADFFWFLAQDPAGYKKALRAVKRVVLTPNLLEFGRLVKLVTGKEFDATELNEHLKELEKYQNEFEFVDFGAKVPELKRVFDWFEQPNLVLLVKYKNDIIVTKDQTLVVKTVGSRKRCGGLGDLLAGVLAQLVQLAEAANTDIVEGIALSCQLLRRSAAEASRDRPLSLVASDVLLELPNQVHQVMNCETKLQPKLTFF